MDNIESIVSSSSLNELTERYSKAELINIYIQVCSVKPRSGLKKQALVRQLKAFYSRRDEIEALNNMQRCW